jgi:hypothetical protein
MPRKSVSRYRDRYMPRKKVSRYRDRYNELRSNWFLPLEARELARLPKSTPALKEMIADRLERRARFEHVAATKIASGKWRRTAVHKKWLSNLSRMYSKRSWRVKEGPKGGQQVMAKRAPNPWAMYRSYVKQSGDKGYVSPWELKQIKGGKTALQQGLIFVQGAERKLQAHDGTVNKGMIRSWMDQKDESIKHARGKHREQLLIERRRLEKLL